MGPLPPHYPLEINKYKLLKFKGEKDDHFFPSPPISKTKQKTTSIEQAHLD